MSDWHDEALCRQMDPEMFFGTGPTVARAKKFCRRCPVLDACRDAALSAPFHEFGVWGGLSEPERARLRRRRGLVATIQAGAR